MRQLRSRLSVLRVPAAMLLTLLLHACTHWVALPEPKGIAESGHSMFRLTVIGEHSKVIVKHPKIEGDSVVYNHHGRQTIPLSRVSYAEAHQNDAVATGFFCLAGVLFGTVVILANTGGL